MRKVLASRKMLCEECKECKVKGNDQINTRKKKIILSEAQRMHVLNVCGERYDEASLLCVSLCPFSLDFCKLLS